MSHVITLSADTLRRILPHVASEDRRPTLSGVLLEASGAVVATDGHTLAAIPGAILEGVAADVIVRFMEPRKLTAQKVERVTLTLADVSPRASIAVALLDSYDRVIGASLAEVVEGPFPDWRCVFRTLGERSAVQAVAVDPDKLARFTANVGGKKYKTPAVTLDFYGPERAAVVRWDGSEGVGMIMPCRFGELATGVPAWLDFSTATAAAA